MSNRRYTYDNGVWHTTRIPSKKKLVRSPQQLAWLNAMLTHDGLINPRPDESPKESDADYDMTFEALRVRLVNAGYRVNVQYGSEGGMRGARFWAMP